MPKTKVKNSGTGGGKKIRSATRAAAGPSRGKKAASNVPAADRWKKISVTPRFAIWGALWLGALLFTQLLRSPASNIFFGFVTFFPLASLIYALICRASVKLYMISDTATTEKNRPAEYDFRLINESVFPCPFIDAYIKLPQTNSVRTAERCVKVSMAPLSDYEITNEISFRFRGTYEIGVSCLYIYDFFKIIRVKSEIFSYTTVYVLPRKLVIDEDGAQSVSDSASKTKKASNSYEKIEVSDIRDYRLGDPLKSIHWKLSSKTEDLIVKDYNTGTTDTTYIFSDLSMRFPTEVPDKPFTDPYAEPDPNYLPDINELASAAAYEDMNEFCADGVVELTVASVLRELRAGRTVVLLWYDERAVIGAFSFELRSPADFDVIFNLFATAPIAPAEKTVAGLSALVGDSEDAKYIFVLPTLDDPTVTSLCTMPCASDSSSYEENEVIVYSAPERFAHPSERENYLDSCRTQLAEHGLKLIKGSLDGVMPLPEETPAVHKKGGIGINAGK